MLGGGRGGVAELPQSDLLTILFGASQDLVMSISPLSVLRITGVGIFDFTMAWALPTLLRTKEACGDRHRELPPFASLREALAAASRDDWYTLEKGRVAMSGTQVPVRLPQLL
jgi:hypothetical protein